MIRQNFYGGMPNQSIYSPVRYNTAPPAPNPPPSKAPETELPRSAAYLADYSGCGFWRMLWPNAMINAYQKGVISELTVMVLDERWYQGLKSLRVQRQATPNQVEFLKHLRQIANKYNFRLIYEIDDVIFNEDIPDYNKFKSAFVDPQIRQGGKDAMLLCDEMTVTCPFMKEYYGAKTGHQNITVIPNYPPRWWMGNLYDRRQVKWNYEKNCIGRNPKPRVLYPGSGAHFDVENRCNQNDDFAHVRDAIARTVDEFQWVFLGAYPLPLRDLVRSGKIEFHPWTHLYDYPTQVKNLNCNFFVAPLQDNAFNKAKSDLKFIEGCCYGIPTMCQDLCTYENAIHKFTTGDEMIDMIKSLLNNQSEYMKISDNMRKIAETRFLENGDNLGKYAEMYTLPYGDPNRKLLAQCN